MDLLGLMATKNMSSLKVVSGTTHATAGTQFTITHGLTDGRGYGRVPDIAFGLAKAGAVNAAIGAVTVYLVSKGATTCTFRCSDSSISADFFFA